ncbi:hypothetical protein [Arvimicrobium flavum]|uniref:hypothetical protein n=1 Tax=Arvimicrobium flavum TaxID=3393320 RepID=UPI00237AAD89|nr:hypothetical protein [Mesorhizobium shangrilense]
MIRQAIALFIAVAISVAASVTAGHAMRMDWDTSQTNHASHVTAAKADGHMACSDRQSCDLASADLCAFMCAGLLFVFPAQDASNLIGQTADHSLPAATTVRGHDPGRNERPPISHLL